jgi:magnesium-transporting ATPase (P-type)
VDWLIITALFIAALLLLGLCFIAIGIPTLLWLKMKEPKPKGIKSKLKYVGRYFTWVILPTALIALGIKSIYDIGQ